MKSSKVLFATSLGSALEYYDFVIYALAAPYLSQVFFPHANPWISLLQTFGVFAIGYVARPVGGVIFGSLGDRRGRALSFRLAMLMMAGATVAMGCLPGYSQWGFMSPTLLILLRLTQGLAQGAELPGAITLLCEHSEQQQQSARCSWLFSAIGLGSLSAMLVFFLLSQCYSTEALYAYAWRLPFLFGGVLAVFVYWLRRQNIESPEFKPMNHLPLRELISQYPKQIMLGVSLCLLHACLVIFYLYLPAYLQQAYHYPPRVIYALSTLGLCWVVLCLPLLGRFADYYGRQKLLLTVIAILGIVIAPSLYLLADLNSGWLLLFFLLYQTGVGLLVACYPALLANLFPMPVRYTGVALCYNLAYLVAGCLPTLLTYVPQQAGYILAGIALLSLIALTSSTLGSKMARS